MARFHRHAGLAPRRGGVPSSLGPVAGSDLPRATHEPTVYRRKVDGQSVSCCHVRVRTRVSGAHGGRPPCSRSPVRSTPLIRRRVLLGTRTWHVCSRPVPGAGSQGKPQGCPSSILARCFMPSTVKFSNWCRVRPHPGEPFCSGRGDRTRTCNQSLWRRLRFQLRHTPMKLSGDTKRRPVPNREGGVSTSASALRPPVSRGGLLLGEPLVIAAGDGRH